MNLETGILYVLLAPFMGGLIAGIDRKVTARMQGRVGPPVLQPFYDLFKLFYKEVVVVNTAQKFFVMLFFIFIVFTGFLFFSGGDMLLTIFAFTLASIFLVVGAYSTNSPYSSIGAERELLQMMSYEPIMLLVAVGFYIVSDSFSINEMVQVKVPAIVYMPGMFLCLLYILTIKFRKSPFDLSTSHHGHQELVKGITTEFAGPTLAFIELAHWYENVMLLGFIYLFFVWQSPVGIGVAILVTGVCYFIEILIDNVFARVKWSFLLTSCWILGATLGFLNLLILTLM